MFRVTGTKIEVIRGDTGILNFSVVEETLQEGDTVYLTVKEKNNRRNCSNTKVYYLFH